MIIDSHFHLAPESLSTRDLINLMDRNGIARTALIARLCGPIEEPGEGLLSLMRSLMALSATRFLVKPFMSRFSKEGDVLLPSGPLPIDPDPDNKAVFDAVESYPDRLCGWAFVNPRGTLNPVEELKRWESHPGFIGGKAHPFWHRYPPMALAPVAERLQAIGAPLLIHLGFGENGDILPLARAFPRLTIVLAHAGIPFYQSLWREIAPIPTLFVDLSASAFVSTSIMQHAVAALGPQRCLFGTDGPFGPRDATGTFDYGHMQARVRNAFPDPDIQKWLFEATFQRVTAMA